MAMASKKPLSSRMKTGSLYSVLDQVFSVGFSFLLLVMIARFLGVDDLGKYQLAMSVVALVSVASNFGLSAIASREIAKSASKLSLYLGSALVIRFVISLPLTLLCVGLVIWLMEKGRDTNEILVIAVFYSALLSNILLVNGALMSLHRVKQVALINGSYKLVAILAAFAVLQEGMSLSLLMLVLTGIVFIVLASQVVYLKSLDSGFHFCFPRRFSKVYILSSLPLMSISIAELISLRIDSVMLGVMTTTEQVGLYAGAYNIYLAFVLVALAVTRVFFPNFVALHAGQGGRNKAFLFMGKVRAVFLVYSVLVALVLVFGAHLIIETVFGGNLKGAGEPLMVLSIGLPFIVVNRLYNYVLIGLKENAYYLKVAVAGAACNIVLNLILIPEYSMKGAAVATILTEALMFFLAHLRIRALSGPVPVNE